MENAKNSFYLTLRNRLSVLNPARVVVLRGVQRPGILVEENESAVPLAGANVFVLRWTGLDIDLQHSLPLAAVTAEVHYWTEGTSTSGGLDRGRLLSAMDAELVQLLLPSHGPKQNFATAPAGALASSIFWSTAAFDPVATTQNRLTRIARVTLYSHEEAVEL